MKNTYDRLSVGDRLRLKRTLLDMTQDEMAEKINRAPKYYADIERGNCGMSIETLLALSHSLNMSLDYIIFGTIDIDYKKIHTDEIEAVINLLDSCDERQRRYALHMLKIFLAACRTGNYGEDSESDEIE